MAGDPRIRVLGPVEDAVATLAQAKVAFRRAHTAFYRAIGGLSEELKEP